MKDRPILWIAIIVTLLVELILVISVYIESVYIEVGEQRLFSQLLRILFQFTLIGWVLSLRSHVALLVLAGFHIFTGIMHIGTLGKAGVLSDILCIYHIVIGVIIYFHDWLEDQLNMRSK